MKKKKKKILYLSLIAIAILLISGLATFLIFFNKDKETEKENNNKKPESTATPLLYEVTKEGSENKLYLLGSIHAADDRAYPLPDKVLNAYKESDYLAVEFDMVAYTYDYNAQTTDLQKLLCQNGETLKDTMYPETYDMLIKYMEENNIYNNMYEYYRPVLLYSLISNEITSKSDLSSNKGIDMYFLKQAKKDDKEILEVESSEYQYNLLASLPDELFDLLIRFYISYESASIKSTKQLYEAWLEGNSEKLTKLINSETELNEGFEEYENGEELMKDCNEKLMYTRNNEMSKKAEQYFQEGKNVFIVVGAAHIVGDTGMATQLANMGYDVKVVEY